MPIHTKIVRASLTPTIVLDAYTDGDVVGGLLEFDISKLTVNGGLINSLLLVDEDSQAEPYKLYLFDSEPSTIADADAFAPTVDDLKKLCSVVTIAAADYVTVNSMDYVMKEDINNVFSSSTGKLYGYLVANGGTPDYANTDALTIVLWVLSE